jgi:hypothetical protein
MAPVVRSDNEPAFEWAPRFERRGSRGERLAVGLLGSR